MCHIPKLTILVRICQNASERKLSEKKRRVELRVRATANICLKLYFPAII